MKTFIQGMINMVNLKILPETEGSGRPESKCTELSARKWAFSQCRPPVLLRSVERAERAAAIITQHFLMFNTKKDVTWLKKKKVLLPVSNFSDSRTNDQSTDHQSEAAWIDGLFEKRQNPRARATTLPHTGVI